MPTSVRLDEKTGRLVERLAREADQTKSEVIREAITTYGRQRKTRRAGNLYEAIAPYVGVATGGPPDLSERTGEKYHEALLGREKKAAASGGPGHPRRTKTR
ncbi:MAG TPA: ribbon-helix-helix protein, CopG family [Thermoanaerobaculia bacterium]|nr:ribbon-helix-helix protein, CopG family [Thermoanaerobaculia bacterium]